jgi:cytochrome c-type biogenesis protein CcmE
VKVKAKFIMGFFLIVVPLAWLAVAGFEEGKAYYLTVNELDEFGTEAVGMRLKVAGYVVPGSIARRDGGVHFQLQEEGALVDMVYVGRDPVPDTFTDEAQAVAEGTLGEDGVFRASHIQAKCASKYEAAYGESSPTG